MEKHVEALAAKAAQVADHDAAMKFAQAALNVANAMATLDNIKRKTT